MGWVVWPRRTVVMPVEGAAVSSGAACSCYAVSMAVLRRWTVLTPCGLQYPALAGVKGAGMSEAEFLEDYELARRMHGALWAAGDYTRVAEQLTG